MEKLSEIVFIQHQSFDIKSVEGLINESRMWVALGGFHLQISFCISFLLPTKIEKVSNPKTNGY